MTTHDAVLSEIKFDDRGLVPAIAQDAKDGTVLMMAWMNADAVRETLDTGAVTYWSRSRKELWRKGATSGHTQALKSFRVDCDGDTVLLLVDQTGPACHLNTRSCFARSAEVGQLQSVSEASFGEAK